MRYVAYFKFGTNPQQRRGEWDVVAQSVSVAATERHLKNVRAFARAVEKAEKLGLGYGLELVRQPNHRGTTEAIAVLGWVDAKSLLGTRRRRWAVGFVPGIVARKVEPGGSFSSEEIAATLQAIYTGLGDFFEIRFSLMVPRLAMRMAD